MILATPSQSEPDSSARRGRILLVEDEPTLLEGLRDILELEDYEVLTAMNGIEALRVMAQVRPDIIVSDILMPEMDGYQFCSAVRDRPEWANTPLIFLTALSDKPERQRGTELGADDYLAKPVDADELLLTLRARLVASQRLKQQQDRAMENLNRGILMALHREIHQPLNYITAYTGLLATPDADRDETLFREFLRSIREGSERLRTLVEDVIFLVELETGELQRDFVRRLEPVTNLAALLGQMVDAYRMAGGNCGADLELDMAADLPVVVVDRETLQQALLRLIDQTCRSSPGGKGPVQIRVAATSDQVRIAIAHEGPAEQPEPEDDLLARPALAVAQEVARLHSGWLEDRRREGLSGGLILVLPIALRSVLPSPEVGGQETQPQGYLRWDSPVSTQLLWKELQNLIPPRSEPDLLGRFMDSQGRILIVEDDPSLLEGLRDVISLEGYEVYIATNGLEGLEVLDRVRPDLIVSDIRMPHMNGYEFCEAVRSRPEYADVPFIFLTALGEKSNIWQGKRIGADAYLTKPVDATDLTVEIRSRLRRHLEREAAQAEAMTRLKRAILTALNHEFRTPLTYVNAYAEMLADSDADTSEASLRDFLEGIRAGSERLRQLVEDVIRLVQFETGEGVRLYEERRTRIFYMSRLIHQVAERQADLIASRDLALHLSVPADLPAVIGDAELLGDAIGRLINNACKFSRPGQGQILIRAAAYPAEAGEEGRGTLRIAVQDNGIGVAPTELSRIFDMFVQINRAKFEQQGPGLGLTIARWIVRLHEGRLQVDSRVGQGSTFTVVLPIAPD